MTEWAKKKYDAYYNDYMPWLEDKYLAWFGENKASYTAKGIINPFVLPFAISSALDLTYKSHPTTGKLKETKITGDKNIDAIQDGVAEGVGGQLSSGGLLGGVGDTMSKEGVNRAERGDTGPLNKEDGKSWGETLTGGWLGGGKK